MAKKLQEWVPTVANKEKIAGHSGYVRMFAYDKEEDGHVVQVFKNNNSKEDNVKASIVQ